MKKQSKSYPIFVVIIFSLFMLLHQTDKLLIGSLQLPISETFKLNDFQWGLINSGALIVGTILYPIWGYLYDKYSRAKLLALASFVWGATTWLSSIVKTYPAFLATRSSTGIDDFCLPRSIQPYRRLFYTKGSWTDLWNPAINPANRVFTGNDPGLDDRPDAEWCY